MPTQGKVGKFSCLDLHISGYNHLLACNNIDGFKTKLNISEKQLSEELEVHYNN